MLRATLKSLLSRKLRLVLSGMAVVLGVMFVSGSFVLTDTMGRSFDALFANVYEHVDVVVSSAADEDTEPAAGESREDLWLVKPETVDKVRSVPGVATATGQVNGEGARMIGPNGKVIGSGGAPRIGSNWTGEDGLVRLREGRRPETGTEIVINAGLAETAQKKIGDTAQVKTQHLDKFTDFTVVGIMEYSGGRPSLGGSTQIAFHESVAAQLLLGRPGVFTGIDVQAAPDVTPAALRDRVRTALGSRFEVLTGAELSAQQADDIKEELSFVNQIFLGFAAVALFVGIFLILNTFSIIVAQRTRELALMRAMGASRRQTLGAVIIEALVIGLVSSALGLGLGIGAGAFLAWLLGNLGSSDLELAGVGVPTVAIVSAFAVGTLITLVAALFPALRASGIPPVAALQEAATPDRPLTRITVVGALIGAAGGTLLGLGLSGELGDATLPSILGGVLISFIGVALLTPLVARPVVAVIGRLFSWSVPGKLGRLNAGRNPRRTAITAAALMIGIALITGFTTILTSVKSSLNNTADTQVKVDLFVSSEGDEGGANFDPAILDRIKALPGVALVSGEYWDGARINGRDNSVRVASDTAALARMFSLKVQSGTLTAVGPDQVIVEESEAREAGVSAGSTVRVQLPRGQERTMTVAGTFTGDTIGGWILPPNVIPELWTPRPAAAYVQLAPGTPVAGIKGQVDAFLADNPEVTVVDRQAFVDQLTSELDVVILMVQILLALAILIAVLGVVNTLALSVIERTRELGLLRAIGLNRAQTMRMITVEAVVISVFGALLGVVVGSGLGAAVVKALEDEGLTGVTLPWTSIGTYLLAGAVIGILAAVLPAIRAARVNVLNAIAYE
jgi:putative ABC transport system permease protein